MYLILFIFIAILSWAASSNVQRKFNKFSKVPLPSGLSGKEVAEKMLRDNGIFDVTVQATRGTLTDHYNPINKTVNLSEDVYSSRSVAAAAIAAHECGHAVQHAVEYTPLKMRSALVPVISYTNQWVGLILLAGIFTLRIFPQLLLFGIILFALTTLFSFITLPVEIDASRRAVAWLGSAGITDVSSRPMVVSALKSAAYTYVVAALSSLATLMYYVMIFLGGRRNN